MEVLLGSPPLLVLLGVVVGVLATIVVVLIARGRRNTFATPLEKATFGTLHTAKLSPYAVAGRLKPEQVDDLHAALRAVLTDAVNRSVGQGAATLKGEKRSGLRVHARTGLPCPVCGDTVREVSFADRSFQYCPGCQTGGRPLADRRLSRLVR